jgi:hypothetical protein
VPATITKDGFEDDMVFMSERLAEHDHRVWVKINIAALTK